MRKGNTIGLLGGTFDPIHHGHLRAAIEVKEKLNLDKMHLIPCKQPPHRATPLASAEHRLTMTQLAVLGTELIVDDRELRREGPSYTLDTLISFRREYPISALYMVLGTDAFLGLPSWHQWEKIIDLTHIVVMHRSEWHVPENGVMAEFMSHHTLLPDEELIHSQGKVIQCPITALDISASKIRKLCEEDHTPKFLLPEKVQDYIEKHRLYSKLEVFNI